MLEFLINFIEDNLILVMLCVITLAIASVYSKGVKIFSLYFFAVVFSYFIFSCLYSQGLELDILYNYSSKCVTMFCHQNEYLQIFYLNHTLSSTKIFDNNIPYTITNAFVFLIGLIMLISFLAFTMDYIYPTLKRRSERKFKLCLCELNKSKIFMNTINSKHSKFILNSVFRC